MTSLILNIVGPDKPGLVSAVSEQAAAFGANWMESRMINLAGQFAGIVHLQIEPTQADALIAALLALDSPELRVFVTLGETAPAAPARLLALDLVGQDRPGIVKEISRLLAERGVSIEELNTECISGPQAGGTLFRATARLLVPAALETDTLQRALESLADDLMVDVTFDHAAPDVLTAS